MNNGKMNFTDLKLLEKDLHRPLTDDEAVICYTKGWKALLENIGLNDEKYIAYRRLIDLLITYCTKDKVEFLKLRQAKDYKDSFELLIDFVNDCLDDDAEKDGFDLEEDESDPEEELDVDDVLECLDEYYKHNECSGSHAPFWFAEYKRLFPDMGELRSYIESLIEDDEDIYIQDELSNIEEITKEAVVVNTANRLANKDAEKLPKVLAEAICDYIDEHWTNYSIQLCNGVLKIKKY